MATLRYVSFDEFAGAVQAPWYAEVEAHLGREDAASAFAVAEQALAGYQQHQDTIGIVDALRSCAKAALASWHWEEDEKTGQAILATALARAHSCFDASKEMKDGRREAALLVISKGLFSSGDRPQARQHAEQAQAGYGQARLRSAAAATMVAICLDDTDEAQRMAMDAAYVFDELEDSDAQAFSARSRFALFMHHEDRWQALAAADDLAQLAPAGAADCAKALVTLTCARLRVELGCCGGAAELALQAAADLETLGERRLQAEALVVAARASIEGTAPLTEGEALAQRALSIFLDVEDRSGQGAALQALALACRAADDDEGSASRLRGSSVAFGQAGRKREKATVLRELSCTLMRQLEGIMSAGQTQLDATKLEEPLRTAQASLSLYQQVRDNSSEEYAYTLQVLSNALLMAGDKAQARRYIKESLQVFKKIRCAVGEVASLNTLCQIQCLDSQVDAAVSTAVYAEEKARRCGDAKGLEFARSLSAAFARTQLPSADGRKAAPARDLVDLTLRTADGRMYVLFDNFESRRVRKTTANPTSSDTKSVAPEEGRSLYSIRWVKKQGWEDKPAPRIIRSGPGSSLGTPDMQVVPVAGVSGSRRIVGGTHKAFGEDPDADLLELDGPLAAYEERIVATRVGGWETRRHGA